MRFILHAGMPKTGSTAIQVSLARRRADLLEAGILYPTAGRSPGQPCHRGLFSSAVEQPAAFVSIPPPDVSFRDHVRDLEEEIAAHDSDQVLLSSELLWNPEACDAAFLRLIEDALPADEITILVGLRSVLSQARSAYAQVITGRQRYAGDAGEFIDRMERSGVWHYAERLQTFADVFGAEAVKPYRYDDTLDHAMAPLLRLIGLHDEPDDEQSRRANVSRNWAYVRARRITNRRAEEGKRPAWQPVERATMHLLGRLDRVVPKDSFSPFTADHEARLMALDANVWPAVESAFDLDWWK